MPFLRDASSRVTLQCGICTGFLSEVRNDRFVNTPCGHIFHESHIRRWLLENPGARCPIDKKLVDISKLTPIFGYDPSNRKLKVKVAVLGDSGVGKTSLARSFASGFRVRNTLSTISYDLHTRNLVVDSEDIVLQIWDPSGQERFHASLPTQALRECHGVIFCYDPMHFKSLANLTKFWTGVVSRYVRRDDCARILVECKSDMASCTCRPKTNQCRPVTQIEKETALQLLGYDVFSTSVEESSDVQLSLPFIRLIQKILRNEILVQDIIADSQDRDRFHLDTEDEGNVGRNDDNDRPRRSKKKCC